MYTQRGRARGRATSGRAWWNSLTPAQKAARVRTLRSMAAGKSFRSGTPSRKGGLNLGINWRTRARTAYRSRAGTMMGKMRSTPAASRQFRAGKQSFNKGAVAQQIDDGVVLLKHREFLGVVNSSVDFEVQTYELNPGLDRTFPWAAGIANQFQQYKIRSMCWEFVSTSATSLVSGTNTALGQIAMATQYDSVVPEFSNLADMLNSQWATSTKISSNLMHPIECERGQTTSMPQYVRNAPPPPGADIRLYDLGRTTIATYGAQASNQVGQIWISYVIELYKPISQRQNGGDAENAFYTMKAAGSSPNRFADGYWLGQFVFRNWDSIGITFDLSTVRQPKMIFPVGASGYYNVQLAYFPADVSPPATMEAGTITATNGVIIDDFYNQQPTGTSPTTVYAGDRNGAAAPGVNQIKRWVPCFFVFIADPEKQCVLTWDINWTVSAMTRAEDNLNILVCQMYNGAYQYATNGSTDIDCCDNLQTQVDELRTLIEALQEEDALFEELLQALVDNDALLQEEIDACCGDDEAPPEEMKVEEVGVGIAPPEEAAAVAVPAKLPADPRKAVMRSKRAALLGKLKELKEHEKALVPRQRSVAL